MIARVSEPAPEARGKDDAVRLLVFAHTPPPHHGQSYMVQLLVAGFGGDHRGNPAPAQPAAAPYGIACYHVNTRLSAALEDIGALRWGKPFLLLRYCAEALWCRLRHRAAHFYYVPAPGKNAALYRDWLVMLLCRPFFRTMIFHWHAAGLPEWLESGSRAWARALTRGLLGRANLSVVLSRFNEASALKLQPVRLVTVNNGIPDPCPDFEKTILPRRRARVAARRLLLEQRPLPREIAALAGPDPALVRVLYLAHGTREKGVFDTLAGVAEAQARLVARASPLCFELEVAGEFVDSAERAQFEEQAQALAGRLAIHRLGFVASDTKWRALTEADIFCFPTYYRNENQPVNLIEAMAFGLPIVTSRWRSVPELLPGASPRVVAPQAPAEIATMLLDILTDESFTALRAHFLAHYTVDQHLASLARVILETTAPDRCADD